MPNKTTNYKLNKPLANENVDIEVLNANMDTIDTNLKAVDTKAGNAATAATNAKTRADSAYSLAGSKANKATVTIYKMLTSGWNVEAKTYSFESQYPSESYDIEIEASDTCTEAQKDAFDGARLTGSATTNVVKAFGDIPSVDIPVIIKVVAKNGN